MPCMGPVTAPTHRLQQVLSFPPVPAAWGIPIPHGWQGTRQELRLLGPLPSTAIHHLHVFVQLFESSLASVSLHGAAITGYGLSLGGNLPPHTPEPPALTFFPIADPCLAGGGLAQAGAAEPTLLSQQIPGDQLPLSQAPGKGATGDDHPHCTKARGFIDS